MGFLSCAAAARTTPIAAMIANELRTINDLQLESNAGFQGIIRAGEWRLTVRERKTTDGGHPSSVIRHR
jgi:hypothetical protein